VAQNDGTDGNDSDRKEVLSHLAGTTSFETASSLRLMRAFMSIKDLKVRDQLVLLMETIAAKES